MLPTIMFLMWLKALKMIETSQLPDSALSEVVYFKKNPSILSFISVNLQVIPCCTSLMTK